MTYTEATATSAISRNGGIVKGKAVYFSLPGIKMLGAIDYLVAKHGYRWLKSRV